MDNTEPSFRVPYEFAGDDLEDLLDRLSPSLRSHSRRVAASVSAMAEQAKGFIYLHGIPAGTNLIETAYLGGMCHDIGKLLPATGDDYFKHPADGAVLLETYRLLLGEDGKAQLVLGIVRHHHERPGGKGFPDGLHTKDIPLLAGLCAVADGLDHYLYNKEPKHSAAKALDGVRSQAGGLFCEYAVTCLERAWPRIKEQYEKWNRQAV